MSTKRFRIAFSFAGEKRDFVEQVAEILTGVFNRETILYDKYHEAEFARSDLSIYLPDLYNKQADLVVVVACPNYQKDWPGLEWLAIHNLLKHRQRKEVMLGRYARTEVEGLFDGAGFVELDDKSPSDFALLILQRLAHNEGNPRDYYQLVSSTSSFGISHSTPSVPSNLPGMYANCVFVGRDLFLDDLRASLVKKTHATAIMQAAAATGISGLGGIGKTHAAVEYARRHSGDYTATLFVSGDSPERLDASFSALVDVLPLGGKGDTQTDQSARVATVMQWFASHEDWLLIVDNVDDEAAAAALTGYFGHFGKGHVLITTRLQNWADNVESLPIEVLSLNTSIQLLLKLTASKRRKTSDDDAQASLLAEMMEGLPLALHQAAGYINEQRLTFADYIAIYEHEAAELLGWFKSHVIHYERFDKDTPKPVIITWKASFDKLDADTRFWLLVFSHFAHDPIPEFLLESKPDAKDEVKVRHRAVKRALAQAETYSLLTRYDTPPRFKVHRLVQCITRLIASETERAAALEAGIQLFSISQPGNPLNVSSWSRWNPLQTHASSLITFASDIPYSQGLNWLLNQLGNLLAEKSLYAQAEPIMRRALSIDEGFCGANDPRTANALNNLAQLLHDTDRLLEAEPLMRRALAIDEVCLGPNHPNVARDLNNLARLLQAKGCLGEAEPLMRRVIEIDEQSVPENHPVVAIHLSNLGQLLKATNRLSEAEPLMKRALQIEESNFGDNHPNVARHLTNIAQLHRGAGKLQETELLMRRALKINQDWYGLKHSAVAIDLNNLATFLMLTDRPIEAEPLLQEALEIDEALFGAHHPRVATILGNLAILFQSTRINESELLLKRALKIDEASYGPDHRDVGIRLNNLARLLQSTKRPLEAEPLIRRAFGIFVNCLGLDHPDSQAVAWNYLDLLHSIELPEIEIQRRLRTAITKSE